MDMHPAVYDVSGSGPLGHFFSLSISGGTAQVPRLSSGQWTITVTAKNKNLQGIGQGSGVVAILPSQISSLAISIAALSGNGTISLTVLLPSGLVASTLSATLAPSAGTAIPLAFVAGASDATCYNPFIPSGYYTISLRLIDGGTLRAEAVDIIRIVGQGMTQGVVNFSSATDPAQPIHVAVTQPANDSIAVTLQGGVTPIVQGTSMTVSASPSDGICRWFLDGSEIVPTAALGPTVIVSATPAGKHRLVALVFSADGLHAGSASYDFVATPAISTAGPFDFGVWMQYPTHIRNGSTMTSAQEYKSIGINLFVGLWGWPDESGNYIGYNLDSAQALQASGVKAFAGNNLAAVAWNKAHPEYASTFTGYILGDEPDMNQKSGDAATAAAAQPDAWLSAGTTLSSADPSKERYANFGKGFALDPWNGYTAVPGSTQLDDFNKYVGATTLFSSDLYGITDPYEDLSVHGIWAYGRSVDNNRKYAGSKAVWGFVESSAPFSDTNYAPGATNYIAKRMLAQYIAPAVWEMIVHGATGIVYFPYDFSTPATGAVDGMLAEPGMSAAVKAVADSVTTFGTVLATPTILGAIATSSGAVPVTLLVKHFGGSTYVFAMGDGNSSNIYGLAVTAHITIPGAGTGTVQVVSDSRTLPMTDGTFIDNFNPYELHIYKL